MPRFFVLSFGSAPARAVAACRRSVRTWAADQGGATAMIFGLLLIPLTAMVGLAVDLGRVYNVSFQTQAALDAAALAAGRVAQVESTDTVNKASAAASAFFNESKPTAVASTLLQFSPNALETEFTVTATTWVRTPFLASLNFIVPKGPAAGAPSGCASHFACVRIVTTSTAELKVGGNGGENIEISLMLDVTGSMQGDKIDDLKASAKDLIDIVIWDDQSEFTSKVALVPFSQAVNVGKEYFKAVTGLTSDDDPDGDGYNYPPSCYNNRGNLKGNCRNKSQYKVKTYSPCVVERTGWTAFTDEAPSVKHLTALDEADDRANCLPSSAKIVPLSDDKEMLKDAVDDMRADGLTAGHLGTAWAWYMLSPEWRTVWPSDSRPGDYGAEKLKKVAVLMTDGEYNTDYYSRQNGDSTSQARSLCEEMKDKDIEVYTVGFDLARNSSATTTLKRCATSDQHFYETTTGEQLRAAFRDIALKVSSLRLTH